MTQGGAADERGRGVRRLRAGRRVVRRGPFPQRGPYRPPARIQRADTWVLLWRPVAAAGTVSRSHLPVLLVCAVSCLR
jgi:hypothetical protein